MLLAVHITPSCSSLKLCVCHCKHRLQHFPSAGSAWGRAGGRALLLSPLLLQLIGLKPGFWQILGHCWVLLSTALNVWLPVSHPLTLRNSKFVGAVRGETAGLSLVGSCGTVPKVALLQDPQCHQDSEGCISPPCPGN